MFRRKPPTRIVLPLLVASFAGLASQVGCVNRPIHHRPGIDQLIQESLDANRPRGGAPRIGGTDSSGLPVVGEILQDGEVIEVWEDDAAETWIDGSLPDGMVNLTNPLKTEAENSARINEDFMETDIREALLAISDEAGIDLIIDTKVQGLANARLEDLDYEQALEKVLMPLGFHYAKKGKQHFVGPADPESPLFPYLAQRSEYRPKHMEAKAILETLPDNFQPFVQEISGSNLIMIEAPHRISSQISERLASVDQQVPQVVLEAIICVVSPDSGLQYGLDWEHAVELNGQNALKFASTGLAMSSSYSGAGANAIFDDFAKTSTFVKLLSEHGYLTIRASPHVMAQNNKKASIAINRETFFSVQPQAGGNGDNSSFFFQQDIQTVQSGITLDITPQIRGDIVTINIEKAEVSEDVRNANTELALNPFPIITRRSVSTTVHVKDGKTIVIGGLVQRETVDRVNRVPGLSRIPLLGYLFETTQRQTRDAEVVIFISPRIVGGSGADHCLTPVQ